MLITWPNLKIKLFRFEIPVVLRWEKQFWDVGLVLWQEFWHWCWRFCCDLETKLGLKIQVICTVGIRNLNLRNPNLRNPKSLKIWTSWRPDFALLGIQMVGQDLSWCPSIQKLNSTQGGRQPFKDWTISLPRFFPAFQNPDMSRFWIPTV